MSKQKLIKKLQNKSVAIGVVGLGYVGLPLALRYSCAGHRALGIDINPEKVVKLNQGESYYFNLANVDKALNFYKVKI